MELPKQQREALEQFVQDVQATYGDSLVSVALYGSAARGEYAPQSSDLNVLVVLDKLGVSELKAVQQRVHEARRTLRLAPFFVTRQDLERSTDVFPLRFLDMQESHVTLAGVEVLRGLQIGREHIRLACEQSAKNMVLKLRQLYLARAHLRPALVEVLTDNIGPFLRVLRRALRLEGHSGPRERAALLAEASTVVGLHADSLERIWAMRGTDAPLPRHEVESLYDAFLTECDRLANWVDALRV